MNRKYWNSLAADYQSQVREISELDLNGVLVETARKLGGKSKKAVDFGCGPGAITRTIAPFFGKTIGVDFSEELLELARKSTADPSVSYARRNLETSKGANFRCDVAFCANVLINERFEKRQKIARTVAKNVRKNGRAVFVVPSLESQLRIFQVLMKSEVAAGVPRRTSVRAVDRIANTEMVSLSDGIFVVGGTPTKHYMADELQEFLGNEQLRVETLEGIEYSWDEELDDLPADFTAPCPWDWMAVCVKQ